jgi:hypothetical protein
MEYYSFNVKIIVPKKSVPYASDPGDTLKEIESTVKHQCY